MKKLHAFLILIFIFLSGCTENPWFNKGKSACLTHEEELHKLNKKVHNLEAKISSMKFTLDRLQNSVLSLSSDFKATQNQIAFFTPSSRGYYPVHTDFGNLLVSLDSLTKYADGYKAIFNIGNPNYATFSGLKINITWGSKQSKSTDDFKKNEVTINKPILPGMWNKVEVILSPATAKETGIMAVMLTADKVVLNLDYRNIKK